MALSFSLSDLVRSSLTPELLKPKYRGALRPFAGHCYVASEAFFHLSGGKLSGYIPMFVRHEGEPHWWIKGPQNEIWDLTKEQFNSPVPYQNSVAKGFLTRMPSKRAQIVIDRVQKKAPVLAFTGALIS